MLLISIVLAKSNLSTESIGRYELFLFVVALFSSFWINGIIQSFLPLFRNNKTFKSEKEKSPEFFNAFILISGLSIFIVLIIFAFTQPITNLLEMPESEEYFYLVIAYIIFSSPSFLIEYVYLLLQKPQSIIKYGLITFPVQFVIVSLPAVLGYQIEICLAGLVVSAVMRYVWLLFLLSKHAAFQLSTAFIREHLHFAYPLIITTLLGASANYIDGFLVLNHFDNATFAIFRYGAKEFPLVLLMANALSNAMIPEFSRKENFSKSLSSLRQKTTRLMHLLFPVTILFLISSYWLYPIVFNSDFLASAAIFNIYLLLITSRLVFPHTLLIGLKKTKIIMFASALELITNISLSILFIQFWGIEGVAAATVIAYAVQKIIWLIYNKRNLGISVNEYLPVKLHLFYSGVTIIVFFATYFIYFN